MSEDKIEKLRELAERGIGGEKENARAMLAKAGIDWKKPEESFVNKVKQGLGMNIEKKYKFPINYPADLLFLQVLKDTRTKSKRKLAWDDNNIVITCTPAEIVDINNLYKKHKERFGAKMVALGEDYFNTLL